jgi:Zn-dependent M28 family amino/carboxypeptidase
MKDPREEPHVTTHRNRLTGGAALLGAAALATAALAMPSATAGETDAQRKAKDGTLRGAYDHVVALEEIADDNGGTRASGTPGYEASADYVAGRLRKAGYAVEKQEFEFPYFVQNSPSVFEQTAPEATTYEEDVDYALMTYSGSGDVTAPVQAVDLDLANPDPLTTTSGCEDSDFAGFVEGNIALVRRGTCAFGDKATNATEAGAAAVIVMNRGGEGATDAFAGTLGAPIEGVGPVIGTSFAIGQALAADGAEAHVVTDTESDIRTTWNVIADSRTGNKKNVVMAGAHLDSVGAGEGVNDNGSGSAALLETAEAMAKGKAPENALRFAWWGAEELGLLGSEYYVAKMAEEQPRKFQKIALYLNFDMVASPNYVLGVYDGNNDSFPPEQSATAPEGSAAIERRFHRFFDQLGTGSVDTAFSGRSDYGPFIALNVPSGGLFTGAEGVKTDEEAAMFGGAAGVAYDECYHADCDDIGNVNRRALKANLAAIMDSVERYARSTRTVNGDSTGHEPAAEPMRMPEPRDELHGAHHEEHILDHCGKLPTR